MTSSQPEKPAGAEAREAGLRRKEGQNERSSSPESGPEGHRAQDAEPLVTYCEEDALQRQTKKEEQGMEWRRRERMMQTGADTPIEGHSTD